MVPSAWRHAGRTRRKDVYSILVAMCPQLRLERNSLSGKETCPAVPQGTAEYRLISGKPYLPRGSG
jgi:hypothetical protein